MASTLQYTIANGNPGRLGAHSENGGVEFAAAIPDSQNARLILTDLSGNEVFRVDLKDAYRVGDVSAVLIKGADARKHRYFYEINGEVIQDPYCTVLTSDGLCGVDVNRFKCNDSGGLKKDQSDMLIYKLHVRGFTMKSTIAAKKRGTFRGLKEKISYIKDLGFNTVELMPVYAFDPTLKVQPYSGLRSDHAETPAAEIKTNYWGYSEKNLYFSPNPEYSMTGNAADELRDAVQAFHDAGISVILEFYFPENTESCVVIDVLHHWKLNYHIDGFHLIGSGIPSSSVMNDPLLKDTQIMLDWIDSSRIRGSRNECAKNLLECNDSFMECARGLLKGDEGRTEGFANCIRRNPKTHGFVNYLANTNGFTLADAVSYDWKHNEANGEGNRDGSDYNISWNCGIEGPTKKASVRRLRMKQLKNALSYLFLSQGVPLLMAGDECLNTQNGNNNAYCADDPVGWMDWNRTKEAEELRQFVKELTAFRRQHPILHMKHELKGSDYRSYGYPDISYHDTKAWMCSFENVSRTLAVMYCGLYTQEELLKGDSFVYVMYNSGWDAHPFAMPALPKGYNWEKAFETSGVRGEDPVLMNEKYCDLAARSVCVFTASAPEKSDKKINDRKAGN